MDIKQARASLAAVEQMRQQFVCNGTDHDKLRMAVANLQQFIADAGKKPEPEKKPKSGKAGK